MIICICNTLREKELRAACNEGCEGKAMCAKNVMEKLGCSPVCGQCLCYIDEIAEDSMRQHPA